MNFFFGLKTDKISSEIKIPQFNYSNIYYFKNHKVFKATPNKDKWKISSLNCIEKNDFFLIDNNQIDNNSIYFLANDKEIKKFSSHTDFNQLENFNKFTDNDPVEFRANLKLTLKYGGCSSYQSEYSYLMTKKEGNILSPLNSLFNTDADENLLVFRNISFKPEIKKFYLYLISLNENKVLNKYDIYSNTTNFFEIDKKFIKQDVFIFTVGLIGIPLYLSIKKNHLSFEHTHPPHHYILSNDRFKIISNLKKKFKKIVDENAFKK